MHFSARNSSFFFVEYGARPFLEGHFLRHNFFFMIFFILACKQDEAKQLSSWKFFDWNRFGNRFGNDVSRLKKNNKDVQGLSYPKPPKAILAFKEL